MADVSVGHLSIGGGEGYSGRLSASFIIPEQQYGPQQIMSTSPAGFSDTSMSSDVGRHIVMDHDSYQSLDSIPDRTAFLLGDTGESDPYLSRHFAQNNFEQSFVDKVQCRHIEIDNNISAGTARPLVFYLADHSLYKHGEPRLNDLTIASLTEEVDGEHTHSDKSR